MTRDRMGAGLIDGSSAWLVVIGILVGYFTLLMALGGHDACDALGVPPVPPGFFDLRSVTSGWECARQDVGAWPDDPCDPWGRPESYPRIWIAASAAAVAGGETLPLAALAQVLAFAGLACLLAAAIHANVAREPGHSLARSADASSTRLQVMPPASAMSARAPDSACSGALALTVC